MNGATERIRYVLGVTVVLSLLLVPVSQASAVSVTTIATNPNIDGNSQNLATDGVNLYFRGSLGATTPGNALDFVPIGGGSVSTLYPSSSPCCAVSLTHIGSTLYWIDPNGDPDATAIFKGSTGGGPITKIYSGFATGQPIVDGTGLTTDGTFLYTADAVQGRVHRMNPDGTGITFLGSRYGGFFDAEHMNKIAQDDGFLYVMDTGAVTSGGTFAPGVFRISKTGGPFTTLFSGGPFVSLQDIAIGNGMIFVTDAGADAIWEMPLTGGAPTVLVSGGPFVNPYGLTFHNDALYVSDYGAHSIFKVDLAEPVPEPASLLLLGSGLAGLAALRRRSGQAWRRKRANV